jgi:phage gp36-like protein
MTAAGLDNRFESIPDIVTGLTALEAHLYQSKDRRAVFTSAYLTMTREIASRVEDRQFNEADWVNTYTVAFGNLFRAAFLASETGSADVPAPWQIAFETAASARGLIIQDLLLGMNAHINHDLALALFEASIEVNREARRADHFAVNEAIRHAVDAVQASVADRYGRVFAIVDSVLHRLDEDVSVFSIEKARLNAWTSALALTAAGDEHEKREVLQSIADRSSAIARLILLPTQGSLVFRLRRALLRATYPWKLLTPGF